MNPSADLSPRGLALLLGEFLDALALDDVTLVLNDWGGPPFLITEGRDERVARLVMVACEAFDNFPPKPARGLIGLIRVPGGTWLVMQLLRTRFGRHHDKTYGALSKRGIPDDVLDDWFVRRPPAGRSAATCASSPRPPHPGRSCWNGASGCAGSSARPWSLWSTEDLTMPREHGRRLADMLPQGRLVEIDDALTLVPEDQPDRLAEVLREFLADS